MTSAASSQCSFLNSSWAEFLSYVDSGWAWWIRCMSSAMLVQKILYRALVLGPDQSSGFKFHLCKRVSPKTKGYGGSGICMREVSGGFWARGASAPQAPCWQDCHMGVGDSSRGSGRHRDRRVTDTASNTDMARCGWNLVAHWFS